MPEPGEQSPPEEYLGTKADRREAEPQSSVVVATEAFMSGSFKENPHFSFWDWTIMHEHSLRVREIALHIAEEMDVDYVVLQVGALLHDIGKTHEGDEETLHIHHEDFNWTVAEPFLRSQPLTVEQLEKLEAILGHKSESVEMKVVEDADALALYADQRLYTVFIDWARSEGLEWAIQRKLDKYDRLNFAKSKEIGRPWLEQMKQDWQETIEILSDAAHLPPLEAVLSDPVLARNYSVEAIKQQIQTSRAYVARMRQKGKVGAEVDELLVTQDRENMQQRVLAGDSVAIEIMAGIGWFQRAAKLAQWETIEKTGQTPNTRYYWPARLTLRQRPATAL